MFRTSWLLALSAITLSCGGSTHGPDPQPPGGSPVEISIAAVTLAQDCGTGPTAAVSEREAPESR